MRKIIAAFLFSTPAAAQDVFDISATARCAEEAFTSEERSYCVGAATRQCLANAEDPELVRSCIQQKTAWWEARMAAYFAAITLLLAGPALAQAYTEADAFADVSACLEGAAPAAVAACYGAAQDKCALVTPDPEVEFVEPTCPEAEQEAWARVMEATYRQSYLVLEAHVARLEAASSYDYDYQSILARFEESQINWEDYANTACRVVGLKYVFEAGSGLPEVECHNRLSARRVGDLRALAALYQ